MYSQAVVLFLCAFNVMSATADDTCPPIVSRKEWGAVPAKSVQPLSKNPPPYVVVHHSASQICTDEESCKRYVRSVQHFHMDIRGWEDIGYNFLVSLFAVFFIYIFIPILTVNLLTSSIFFKNKYDHKVVYSYNTLHYCNQHVYILIYF
ncbi:unnamed protein product [Acanthoscelides obtectus]|uniref:Peptidoglycan recognition protein family domain-containing protein n=1 Tax=Acanthoscelides obtectus TaxID=200917 RepID=A0A9P0Q6C2_ACAOB|nr:unnamed protein product [Acanthoscelides obtectus]CAK1640881.1 Peptidoglycan recognition protein 1 [Acanthoscelides obtectus]